MSVYNQSATTGGYNPIPPLSINTVGGLTLSGSAGHDELTQQSTQGLNIRVVPASGGHIVSIRRDNNYSNSDLHIINEEKDLGAELGKIITLHYLKT
jgi:hypothetical protein